MKRLLIGTAMLLIAFPLLPINAATSTTSSKLKGKILLQVESRGEAWYVHPTTAERYYMADGNEAYNIMRNLGVGIKNSDLDKLKNNKNLALKQKGKIFLQVESRGEAYYVNSDGTLYYLQNGAEAYNIMRKLGLGITNNDLAKINTYKSNSVNISAPTPVTTPVATTATNKEIIVTQTSQPDAFQDTLFIQAKSLVNNNIEEYKRTLDTSDKYIKLMEDRKTSLSLKISRANEIVDILSTMTSSAAPSLIKAINAINKEYEYDIANMQEYKDILVPSRDLFSSQLLKMNALSKTLDDSQKISSYPYQKVIDSLNNNKSLFSDASLAIEKNLETFKSSSATKDIQYAEWRNKVNSTISMVRAMEEAPIPSSTKTDFKCYVNSSYSGKISSLDCY